MGPDGLSRRSCNLRDGSGHGELDGEDGTTFGLVVAADLASVVLNHSVDGAEAEAGAFADGLGGVEGIENAFWIAQSGPVSENWRTTSAPSHRAVMSSEPPPESSSASMAFSMISTKAWNSWLALASTRGNSGSTRA